MDARVKPAHGASYGDDVVVNAQSSRRKDHPLPQTGRDVVKIGGMDGVA
jgi:hypothetical protein